MFGVPWCQKTGSPRYGQRSGRALTMPSAVIAK